MNIPFTEIELKFYNLLSCKGFETAENLGLSFGPCAVAKLGIVFLFFINAFMSKWVGEEAGIDYSFWGGLVGSIGVYLVIIFIIGSFKISFLAGLIGMMVFGFGGGAIFGGGDGND